MKSTHHLMSPHNSVKPPNFSSPILSQLCRLFKETYYYGRDQNDSSRFNHAFINIYPRLSLLNTALSNPIRHALLPSFLSERCERLFQNCPFALVFMHPRAVRNSNCSPRSPPPLLPLIELCRYHFEAQRGHLHLISMPTPQQQQQQHFPPKHPTSYSHAQYTERPSCPSSRCQGRITCPAHLESQP